MNHFITSNNIKIISFFFLLILPLLLFAEDFTEYSYILSDITDTISINNDVDYFIDEEGAYQLDEILLENFSRHNGDLNFGLTHDYVWLRFGVDNRSQKGNWVLEFNIHKFYTVEIYTALEGETPVLSHSYSYKQPFREREIQEPYLAFHIEIPQKSHMTFYVKVKSENSLEIPLLLHTSESFFFKITQMKSLFSTIYGILIAMFVYNIFIYFFLRDNNYLLYVSYVLVYTIYLSALNGYGANYLWPFVAGRWTTIFSALFGGISLAIGCYLTREFLQTRIRNPVADKALVVLAALGLLLSIIIFIFEKFMVSFIYGNIIGTIVLLGILTVTIISYAKGYKPALYFLFSYSTIIVAQIVYSLLSISPFGDYFFLKNMNQYAPVFQMVLLSLSLSYRFNLMRIEKDEAQESALKAEMTLASGLEEKVNERTRELKAANDKLEALSFTDPLTGLYNRRYFEKALIAEWKRHGRENLPLSVIMCDIDHFKQYNDKVGHQAGDLCIQKIAQALRDTVRRESDIPGRYGGEEFIIVLPHLDMDGAMHIAQSIKERVDSLKIPHSAFPGQTVTISLGVSSTIPSLENDPAILIESADRALYKSKDDGRNRTTFLEASPL